MTVKYPNSACEAHRNVTTSEPVCVACLLTEVERLGHVAQVWKKSAKNWRNRAAWDYLYSSPQALMYRAIRHPGSLSGFSARDLLLFAQRNAEENKRLQAELSVNAQMLAGQHDRNMELETKNGHLVQLLNDCWNDKDAVLLAEIERLRSSLEKIGYHDPMNAEWYAVEARCALDPDESLVKDSTIPTDFTSTPDAELE